MWSEVLLLRNNASPLIPLLLKTRQTEMDGPIRCSLLALENEQHLVNSAQKQLKAIETLPFSVAKWLQWKSFHSEHGIASCSNRPRHPDSSEGIQLDNCDAIVYSRSSFVLHCKRIDRLLFIHHDMFVIPRWYTHDPQEPGTGNSGTQWNVCRVEQRTCRNLFNGTQLQLL